MTNLDKHLIVILNSVGCAAIKQLRTGTSCDTDDCNICKKANEEWLGAEYKELEVDWSKVDQGAKVYAKIESDKGLLCLDINRTYHNNDYLGQFVANYNDVIVVETGSKFRSFDKQNCKLEKL